MYPFWQWPTHTDCVLTQGDIWGWWSQDFASRRIWSVNFYLVLDLYLRYAILLRIIPNLIYSYKRATRKYKLYLLCINQWILTIINCNIHTSIMIYLLKPLWILKHCTKCFPLLKIWVIYKTLTNFDLGGPYPTRFGCWSKIWATPLICQQHTSFICTVV